MANSNAAQGFRPVRHTDGSPYNGQHELFYVPSTDATAIFPGDIVKIAGSAGTAGKVVSGMDMEGVQTAALATAGTTGQDILGVMVGILVSPTALDKKYRQASVDTVIMVCTDPTVVYEAREDAVAANIAAADVGLNVPYTTTAGDTTRGISQMEIDSSAVATTATLPLKILGLSKRVGNAFGLSATDHGMFEVMLNTGIRMPNVAGA